MLEISRRGFGFLPDPFRAREIDHAIRQRLSQSLETTLEACAGHLTWDERKSRNLLAQLRSSPARAAVMAVYADLVEALFRDDLAQAQTLLDSLLALDPAINSAWRLCTLSDATLGPSQAERFHRIIADDPAIAITISAYDDEKLQAAYPLFESAFTLIKAASPELSAELGNLIREIILVEGRKPNGELAALGGASTFYLWGSTFISFSGWPSRLAVAEALVHEAAHLLLFGFTSGKPLTLNGQDERFESPLRDDKRPMEGVVHAAYVIARLTFFMRHLLATGILTMAEADTARAWQAGNRKDFAAALKIIQPHARFTPIGQAAFTSAVDWMSTEPN